jgi:lactate 2-monooxygenase
VTLDTTLLGWRTRDLELAYLPFLRGKGIAQYASDPVFLASLADPFLPPAGAAKRTVNLHTLAAFAELTRAHPGSFWKNLRSKAPLAAVQQFIATYSRPSLTWADLPFLRERTKLPVLLKGILHPDDARRALDHGMDGIIVSNHGGRQVDGAVATLDALPGVATAVEGRVPVLMDGGIRGGADVFKALALGARAVCVGRPYVYALALAGEAGVLELLRNLATDFELTMGLAGCASIAEIGAHSLAE